MNQTKSTEQEKKEKDMNQLAQKKRRKKKEKKTKYINRMKFLGKGKSIKQFNDSMQWSYNVS